MRRPVVVVWCCTAAVWVGAIVGLRASPRISWLVAAIIISVLRSRLFVVLPVVSFCVAQMLAMHSAPLYPLLAGLAAEHVLCDMDARVADASGSIGTFVRVDTVECGGRVTPVDETAVVDGVRGELGGSLSGRVRFEPIDDSPFGDLRRRGGAVAQIEDIAVRESDPSGIFGAAVQLRRSVQRAASGLEPASGALLAGLTIGDTEAFAASDEDTLRRAGLSHLVAVSGSNVAIVLGAILLFAAPLGLAGRTLLAMVGLVVYVLVVGPQPSVLRAAVMGLVTLLVFAGGRRAEPLIALGIAGAAVVLLRPPLVHSVGLHLSMAACAGLILWAPSLAERLPGPRLLALAAATTVAAQIAVAPLLLMVFGEVSLVAPVANLLAVPAVAPATILGVASGVAGIFSARLGELLALVATPALRWILWVGRTAGTPGWAAVSLPRPLAIVICLGVVGAGAVTFGRRISAHTLP